MTTQPSSLMRAMEAEAGSMLGVDAGNADQLDLYRGEDGKLPSNIFQLTRAEAVRSGPGRKPGSKNKRSEQLAKLIVGKYGDPVEGMAALYAMPLDQLVELLLIADGSKDREDRLLVLADRAEELIGRLLANGTVGKDEAEKLTELAERMGDLAVSLKTKPGELALKALQTQLAARREVAQYVHGKMPVQVDVNTKADVILNIPGLTDAAHLATIVDSPELSEGDLNRLEYVPFGGSSDDAAEAGDDEA